MQKISNISHKPFFPKAPFSLAMRLVQAYRKMSFEDIIIVIV